VTIKECLESPAHLLLNIWQIIVITVSYTFLIT
jgi:hypothetical protein